MWSSTLDEQIRKKICESHYSQEIDSDCTSLCILSFYEQYKKPTQIRQPYQPINLCIFTGKTLHNREQNKI